MTIPSPRSARSPLRARVVLLAGPSGSGKSHHARSGGLPVLALDDFYKDGTDPTLPHLAQLGGLVDWDSPLAWDAALAVDTLERICVLGAADVPVYDIAHDRATSHRSFAVGAARTFVAEGLFAAEIVAACRERGVLADALVLQRAPWKNFVRRLTRDLKEHRKPPVTVLRRGRRLMIEEAAVVRRQVSLGCRPVSAVQLHELLLNTARGGEPREV